MLKNTKRRGPLAMYGGVYFAQRASDGAIKIGRSIQPEKRIARLSRVCGCSVHLLAFIHGTYLSERWLHKGFAEDRILEGTGTDETGEWFRPSGKLLAFVATLPRDSFIAANASA